VSESNVNRQVQALGRTLGQAKVEALRERIADIHPGCAVTAIDEFVDESNWPGLLREPVQALIDACDNVRAKAVLAAWARQTGTPIVVVGAAGGKRAAEKVEFGDLADVTHDPMLAALRQRLRKLHAGPRHGAFGVACVFSREPVAMPANEACAVDGDAESGGHRRQPELPWLRLERRRHCHLRHGRRSPGPRIRGAAAAPVGATRPPIIVGSEGC
jgi:tRNA A37 threonylcarbamoyladenosine dehydratase